MTARAFDPKDRLALTTALVLLTGLASVSITGFQFAINTNVFHVPYVLGLSSAPEFAGDPLYRSLSKFTSAVWPIMRLVASEQNVESLFFGAHVVSRLLAFAAIGWMFRNNGLDAASAVLAGLAVIAVTPWLDGLSLVGRHGLFVNYFTQSEFTWGPLLAALVLFQRRQAVLAAAMTAIVFSINAFVGFWLVITLLVVLLLVPGARPGIRQASVSVLVFLVTASPTALWIASVLSGESSRVDFSYIEYIRLFYPNHFLIDAARMRELVLLALLTWSGLVATSVLDDRRYWFAVVVGCLLVVTTGAVLPYVVNARLIFNLHLLRADGMLQFVCATLVVCGALRAILVDRRPLVAVLGLVALAGLIGAERDGGLILTAAAMTTIAAVSPRNGANGPLTRWPGDARFVVFGAILPILICLALDIRSGRTGALPLIEYAVLLFVLVRSFRTGGPSLPWTLPVSLTIALCVLAGSARVLLRIESEDRAARSEQPYRELVEWVRTSPLHGPFLTPMDGPFANPPDGPFGNFQLLARRQVWVDWKQGGAAMWEPSLQSQWALRYAAVRALDGPDAIIDYASRNSIRNVVLEADECPNASSRMYGNRRYVVCRPAD